MPRARATTRWRGRASIPTSSYRGRPDGWASWKASPRSKRSSATTRRSRKTRPRSTRCARTTSISSTPDSPPPAGSWTRSSCRKKRARRWRFSSRRRANSPAHTSEPSCCRVNHEITRHPAPARRAHRPMQWLRSAAGHATHAGRLAGRPGLARSDLTTAGVLSPADGYGRREQAPHSAAGACAARRPHAPAERRRQRLPRQAPHVRRTRRCDRHSRHGSGPGGGWPDRHQHRRAQAARRAGFLRGGCGAAHARHSHRGRHGGGGRPCARRCRPDRAAHDGDHLVRGRPGRAPARQSAGRRSERRRDQQRCLSRDRGESDRRLGRVPRHEPGRLVRGRDAAARLPPGPRNDRARHETDHVSRQLRRIERRPDARFRVRQQRARHACRGDRRGAHPVQCRGLRRRRTGRAAARAEDRERRAWRHLDDRQYPARDGVRRPLRGAAPPAPRAEPELGNRQRARRACRHRLDRQCVSRRPSGGRVHNQCRERRTGSLNGGSARVGRPRRLRGRSAAGDLRPARAGWRAARGGRLRRLVQRPRRTVREARPARAGVGLLDRSLVRYWKRDQGRDEHVGPLRGRARGVSHVGAVTGGAQTGRCRGALRAAAAGLPGASVLDQGAGVPQLERAYRWLLAGHQGSGYAVRAATGGGSAAFRREGLAGPGDTVETFQARHVTGLRVAQFSLKSDAPWLSAPAILPAGSHETEIPLTYSAAALGAPGVYVGTVTAWNSSDTLAGPVFRLVNVVVVPYVLTDKPLYDERRTVGPGQVRRYFLRVVQPGATLVASVTLADSGQQTARAILYEPNGAPFRDLARDSIVPIGGSQVGTARFIVRAEDAVAGVYELDVVAPPRSGATATVRAQLAPLTLADREATNPGPAIVSGRVTQALLGVERALEVTGRGATPESLTVAVPDWAATAIVEVELPREQWREFTDFGVTEFDSAGQQVSQGPLEYAFGRQAFAVPPALRGHPLTVELYPGFARDKGVHPWRGKLRVRFLLSEPRQLGDGREITVLPGGRAPLPAQRPRDLALPEGCAPLVEVSVRASVGPPPAASAPDATRRVVVSP